MALYASYCPYCGETSFAAWGDKNCKKCGKNFLKNSRVDQVIFLQQSKEKQEEIIHELKEKILLNNPNLTHEIELEKENTIKQKEVEEKNTILNQQMLNLNEIYALNDLYEYDVDTVIDSFTGNAKKEKIIKSLNTHAVQGWRLIAVTTNELGKNAAMLVANSLGIGTNSSVDQTILIYERRIKKAEQ